MSLHDVNQGDFVWIEDHLRSLTVRRLAKIAHIDSKGRLFISADSLWSNWRYGFKPDTGTAQAMESYLMLYASPEEIAQEQARLKAIEEADNAALDKKAREDRIQNAAPELLQQLKDTRAALSQLLEQVHQMRGMFVGDDQQISDAIADADDAIADSHTVIEKAQGR